MALFKFFGEIYSYTYEKDDSVNLNNSNSSNISSSPQVSLTQIKQANEYGIAGFILSLILPLHKAFFEKIILPGEELLPLFILFIFTVIALIISLIGTAKDSSKYQKGLALWGLILNSFFAFQLIWELFL